MAAFLMFAARTLLNQVG